MKGDPWSRLSLKLLVVLLAIHLADVQEVSSSPVNITECSVQHVTFTLIEELDRASQYWFLAACKDNGTCVDGEIMLGFAVEPTVGSVFQVNVDPSCTLSKLSPIEPGLCTLLISSSNIVLEATGSLSTVCTLPTSTPVFTGTGTSTHTTGGMSTHTTGSISIGLTSEIVPSPTGTVGSPSSPVLGVIVAVPLITLLLVVVLLAATAALLMCIKSHKYIQSSPQHFDCRNVPVLLDSQDAVPTDKHTDHDSSPHDTKELDIQSGLSESVPEHNTHSM